MCTEYSPPLPGKVLPGALTPAHAPDSQDSQLVEPLCVQNLQNLQSYYLQTSWHKTKQVSADSVGFQMWLELTVNVTKTPIPLFIVENIKQNIS